MRFVCDSCRAQYMISDDKVGAKGVKVRCKKCGYVILVRPGGASASKDEGAQEAPAVSASTATGAASTSAAGLPASLGIPPEGGLFTDVEEDEIGAVFDQVLNSGSQKIPAGEDARDAKASTPAAVRKLVEAEAEPDADESQAAPPANDWYVAIDEKQVGPLSVEKVKDHWDRGEVGPDSLCWRQGFSDWIPLSEVTELAPVLAPRPAKPVIVAPAAVGAPAAAPAPVESAFSAGAAAKSARAEIPAAPAMGPEPTSSGWKPSAASVLASLVKEENEALSKPPPKPTPVQEKPAAGGGLLDLPPEPAVAPAPRAASVMAAAAAEHAPQPAAMPYAPPAPAPAYAQPVPAYPQPAYAPAGYPQPAYPGYPPPAAPVAQGGNKMGMMIGIAVAAVAVLVVGLFLALRPSSSGETPEPTPAVAVQQPPAAATKPAEQPAPVAAATPPPAANPAVAAATPPPAPAATPPAATPNAVAAATPPPAAVTPPPAAVEPAAAKPSEPARTTESAVARVEPSRTTPKPRPTSTESVSTPTKSRPPAEASDDEFDELFGPKKPDKKQQASNDKPSTYVPPEVGGASRERLGQSDIMEVVLANRPAIVKCVNEQKKKDPSSSGKLVMRWTIQTSGKTTGVSVRSEEFRKTYLATCISGLIKNWTFPKHRKQGDPIDFPFTF